ncbi:MAG: hypothetical protein H6937_02380 [Burkholderiales bacterium]|nr:hypothetical protein [Burkholderiales bacterium]
MAASRKIDYDSIEPDWRAGIKSVPQLADEYERRTGVSVTHGAINKHFKKLGIPRDLQAKIKAKADAKVSAAMVSDKVSGNVSVDTIIEANAEYIANVDINHRKDVRRLSGIEEKLLSEVESLVSNPIVLEEFGEMMRKPDQYGQDKLNDQYHKIISFPGRVESFKKLTETMRIRIDLERRVNKLDDQNTGQERIEDVIARINAAN